MQILNQIVANPFGAFLLLASAAFLEVYGDSWFNTGLHSASGTRGRVGCFVVGALVLTFYGFVVNVPRWDFGKLLGVYVVLFFVVAQVVARVRFGQSPTAPILVGGSLIVLGGAVIALWK